MPTDVLTARALGRATLARQLLLQRQPVCVLDAVGHLVGLQAQEPLDPYTALWSRLEGFRPEVLGGLLEDRRLVRLGVMRGTIHLVTADDALTLRPLVQPVYDGQLARHPAHRGSLAGVDLASVVAYGREVLSEGALTGRELRAAMAARFADVDPAAAAEACRHQLALVQVPPRGVWGRRTGVGVAWTTAEAWLGRPLDPAPSIDAAVLRYLRAFGPATPADAAAWSRLTGLREVFDRLRPQLRTFRDERGRELFDLPDAPRPDPEVPAPVRVLPTYDNVLLSHDDRNRFVAPGHRALLLGVERAVHGSVLDDGTVYATWRLVGAGDDRHVVVDHVPGLTARRRSAVAAELRRHLRFRGEPDLDVRVVPLAP